MNRYAAARSILNIITMLAWGVIVVACVGALGIWGRAGLASAAVLGISGILTGVLLLALMQMNAALLDSAENSFQTVALLEKLLHRASTAPVSVAQPYAAAQVAPAERPAALIKVYYGRPIMREAVGVSVDGHPFNNVLAAERWIDDHDKALPSTT